MTKFRDLMVDDLDAVVRWRNDSIVNRHLSNRLKSKEEAEAWFNKVKTHPKIWLKAVIDDGRIIGYAAVESIDEKNRKCELILIIGEVDYWGRGIGEFVLKRMLEYAFDALHMHRVWVVATLGNDRSERLIKKVGFVQEGVMREAIIIGDKFTDLLCYSILEDEYKT
ncbi:MAG: GNAT family protein [Candidatus Zixiibacteriota bacterium]